MWSSIPDHPVFLLPFVKTQLKRTIKVFVVTHVICGLTPCVGVSDIEYILVMKLLQLLPIGTVLVASS